MNSSFKHPTNVTSKDNIIYLVDHENHMIRKIDTLTKNVTTIAGNGSSGNSDGNGNSASFYNPYGITVDQQGSLLVADTKNHTIRKLTGFNSSNSSLMLCI